MKTKLTEQENYQKASELKNLAEDWVNKTFNFIHVDVLNKCCDDMLVDFIRYDYDLTLFICDYSLSEELKQYIEEQNEIKLNDIDFDIILEEYESELNDFCEQHESFEGWKEDQDANNYPMWNTCFEFRYDPTEEIINSCIKAGFGIIEGMEDFNTLLFVSGCGYSFYGQHWIPAFLSMPWNDKLRKKYEGVNFSMV